MYHFNYPEFHHCLVDRIGCLVDENTSGQARNNFLNFEFEAKFENVLIHRDVVAEICQMIIQMAKKSSNLFITLIKIEHINLNIYTETIVTFAAR